VRIGPVRRYRPVIGEDEVVEGLRRRIGHRSRYDEAGQRRPALARS
jgi:hypothetical protein